MGRIHDTLAALCLLGSVLGLDHIGLVVGKKDHVRPFLDHRGYLLGKLQLPAVICSHLVRLFELPHLSVTYDHYVHVLGHPECVKLSQKLVDLFSHIGIAFSVAYGFDSCHILFLAYLVIDHELQPVKCVDYCCLVAVLFRPQCVNAQDGFVKALRSVETLHIHPCCAPFHIDEDGVRELAGKCALAYPFRSVYHDLVGDLSLSFCDVHAFLLI